VPGNPAFRVQRPPSPTARLKSARRSATVRKTLAVGASDRRIDQLRSRCEPPRFGPMGRTSPRGRAPFRSPFSPAQNNQRRRPTCPLSMITVVGPFELVSDNTGAEHRTNFPTPQNATLHKCAAYRQIPSQALVFLERLEVKPHAEQSTYDSCCQAHPDVWHHGCLSLRMR
jgi:hypothetical protein